MKQDQGCFNAKESRLRHETVMKKKNTALKMQQQALVVWIFSCLFCRQTWQQTQLRLSLSNTWGEKVYTPCHRRMIGKKINMWEGGGMKKNRVMVGVNGWVNGRRQIEEFPDPLLQGISVGKDFRVMARFRIGNILGGRCETTRPQLTHLYSCWVSPYLLHWYVFNIRSRLTISLCLVMLPFRIHIIIIGQ